MTMITASRIEGRSLAPFAFFTAMASRIATRRRNRRIVRDLAGLEDHILEDIGLTRVDLIQASVTDDGEDRLAMLDHIRMNRIG